jgi:hypothetical protein
MQAQNRKGVYVEAKGKFDIDAFFLSRIESGKILILNERIKIERLRLQAISEIEEVAFDYKSYKLFKDAIEIEKKIISENRELLLEEILTQISDKINEPHFKVNIQKGEIKWGKQLFMLERTAENYFAMKQIQYNIKKSFDAKQSSRALIVNQVITLLKDEFPKVVVQADIKEFYESIPHKSLITKINENTILSYPSKKIIKDILNSYWNILVSDSLKSEADVRQGIPRGVGISAYLSELYMKDFDNEVKALSNVTYYSRYVDDIFIVFTPDSRSEVKPAASYKDEVAELLYEKTHLQVNPSKTLSIDFRKKTVDISSETSLALTFLGYKLSTDYKFVDVEKKGRIIRTIKKHSLEIRLSESRFEKYSNRIDIAFSTYSKEKTKYLKKANRQLIKRIRYITGNTRLLGNKNNVFTGIYFSNQYLSQPLTDLIELDEHLTYNVDLLLSSENYLKERLQKFSFVDGFNKKRFKKYNIDGLNKIIFIWK